MVDLDSDPTKLVAIRSLILAQRIQLLRLLDGPLRRILAALGSRPLGQRLFEDGDWQVIGLPVYLDDGLGNAGRAVCWQHVPTGAFLVVQELFLTETAAAAEAAGFLVGTAPDTGAGAELSPSIRGGPSWTSCIDSPEMSMS